MTDNSVLLFTKQDVWSSYATEIAKIYFGNRLSVYTGRFGDPYPDCEKHKNISLILSFLSPWIITADLLGKSPLSLNFHPASCDYPGIGCYNFALYEQATRYGSVCHHMLPKVDTGAIVDEVLFAVHPQDTVEQLKFRTMVAMLAQFQAILSKVHTGETLPTHSRQWTRRPFTRKELNALCEITPDMSDKEKQLRIRATTYPRSPGPYLLKDGTKEFYPVPDRAPLA